MLRAMDGFVRRASDGCQAVAATPCTQGLFDELGILDLDLKHDEADSCSPLGELLLVSSHSKSTQADGKRKRAACAGGGACTKACPSAPRLSPTAAPASLPPLVDAASDDDFLCGPETPATDAAARKTLQPAARGTCARGAHCEARPWEHTLSALRYPAARGTHLEAPISAFYLGLDGL